MLVRYRSNGQAFVELMKGDIHLMIDAVTSATSLIRDGRTFALAVTSAQRSKALPDVPTLREIGVDVVITGWSVLVGPRGIPDAIVQTLNRAGNVALNNPELRAKLSTELKGGTSEDATQLIQKDSAKWGRMIEKFNLKL